MPVSTPSFAPAAGTDQPCQHGADLNLALQAALAALQQIGAAAALMRY